MKQPLFPILPLLPALLLSACAGLGAPSAEAIARLPVVTYGQPAPADGEFVLRYPADTDLPVIATVDGTLLAKTARAEMAVRIKRDVYVYRDQASFDGKTWQPGPSVIGGKFWFALPGDKDGRRNGQSPGELGAEFNLR